MKGMYISVICWLVFVNHGFAVPERIPSDVFEAQRDGYLYADYPGVFDDAEGEGITIEAWIYLTDKPKDGIYLKWEDLEGQWIIFAKPGSYYVVIRGRDLHSAEEHDPEGSTYLQFTFTRQPTATHAGESSFTRHIPPGDFPFASWFHVAMQIVVTEAGSHREYFIDGNSMGSSFKPAPMRRTPAPFLIGGTPIINFKDGSRWGDLYEESFKGYVDEVQVSKGFRYVLKENFRPKRRFGADAKTIALWHFNEGPRAPFYRDSSGNGYTLFPGGSLAVEAGGKLATTWGSMKRGAQKGK